MRWLARIIGIAIWWITKWGVVLVIADYFWTFFGSLAGKLDVYQALALAFGAFGACGLMLIALVKGLDYLANLLPEMVARRKLATLFKDLSAHGKYEGVTLGAVVEFWNDGEPPKTQLERIRAEFRLHHLEAAIGQGYLRAIGPGGLVKENTQCLPSDLATFFGSWKWIRVKDELWKSATYEGTSA